MQKVQRKVDRLRANTPQHPLCRRQRLERMLFLRDVDTPTRIPPVANLISACRFETFKPFNSFASRLMRLNGSSH